MTGHPAPHDHFTPGERLPDPAESLPAPPTRWASAPAPDYAGRPDGAAPWAEAVEPVIAMPRVEPAALRVGWLTGSRPETDPAA